MEDPGVKGVTEADFNSWKHHPVSKVFREYLADKRKFIEQAAVDQWVAGSLSLVSDQCLRGQVIELIEIEELPFAAIANFYGKETDAAEATEDVER